MLTDTKSTECYILNFALVFDLFVKKGVYLNERLPQRTPRYSVFSADPERQAMFDKLKISDHHIFDTFSLFVEIKKQYEKRYSMYFDDKEYQRKIDDVLQYSPLSNPIIVKDILLGKYKHINRDKKDKDSEYYRNKKE